MPEFVQQTDIGPEFWQFLRGIRNDDLLIELIQNELDANSLHTSIIFLPDRLVCTGDGECIDEAVGRGSVSYAERATKWKPSVSR